MLKKHAIAAGIAFAFALPAHAEFRWELGAGYQTGDVEGNVGEVDIDADIDVASVYGSWYFSSVNTEKGPLAEAAFLDRASRVDVLFQDGELDGDIADADLRSYAVGTRWVIDKESGWLIEAAASLDEVENDETESFSIGGGKYIFENTSVVLSYTYSDPDIGDDVDTYAVEVEHLQATPIGALKLEGAYAYADPGDSSDTDNWLGSFTFYPTNRIGVGGSWFRSISGSSSDTWALFAEWFITESIAVSVAYEDTEDAGGFNNNNLDGDSFIASALIRF